MSAANGDKPPRERDTLRPPPPRPMTEAEIMEVVSVRFSEVDTELLRQRGMLEKMGSDIAAIKSMLEKALHQSLKAADLVEHASERVLEDIVDGIRQVKVKRIENMGSDSADLDDGPAPGTLADEDER